MCFGCFKCVLHVFRSVVGVLRVRGFYMSFGCISAIISVFWVNFGCLCGLGYILGVFYVF